MISSALYDEFVHYTKFARATYLPFAARPLGNTNVLQFCSLLISTEGFIARDDKRKEFVIAFRGSQEIQDWITDFTFSLVPLISPGVVAEGIKVHKGFMTAYNAVAPEIITAMTAQLPLYPSYSIVCVGHSLGGALASLGSVSMRANFPAHKLRLFTFGQPRTGSPEYANLVDKLVGVENSYRATHTIDGVPTVIPRSLGYEHHGTEYFIFLDPATTFTVRKCKGHEDPKGSNIFPTTFLNPAHLLYFNRPIGGILLANPLDGLVETPL